MFPATATSPVFCPKCWWSDGWDAFAYGQDFDFGSPFFEQFQKLMMKVPKMAFLQLSNENSDYSSFIAFSRNTYMCPGSFFLEDCYFARRCQYSKDCVNSAYLDHCELVSESINSKNCYDGSNMQNCRNCSSCHYMADSTGCQNCFMCGNLSNKKFYIKNQQYSEAEYNKMVDYKMKLPTKELASEFEEFNKTLPKKYQSQINCENSSGDYIQNCKNAQECYDSFEIEDCKYMVECVAVKDSMDLSMHDKDIELCYEVCSGGDSNNNLKFSFCSCTSVNSQYLHSCFSLQDSFGCDGVHTKQTNCILNKKYSKEAYEELKGRIIEHMKKTGEYGEFFPIQISPHPYNNTTAHDYFPITREEALKNGYKWEEKDVSQYQPSTKHIPQNIKEASDSITNEIFACENCKKNYRIIAQELNLCRKLNQPLSRLCADCRQLRLQKLKNNRKLYLGVCSKCSHEIKTTYPPEKQKNVCCEQCYLKEII